MSWDGSGDDKFLHLSSATLERKTAKRLNLLEDYLPSLEAEVGAKQIAEEAEEVATKVKDQVDELNRVVRTVGEHSHLMATEAKRDLKETMRAAEEQAAARQESLAREMELKMAAKMEELDQFQEQATNSVAYATAEAERMGREAAAQAESQAKNATEKAVSQAEWSANEAQRQIQEAVHHAINLLEVHRGAADQMNTLKDKLERMRQFEGRLEEKIQECEAASAKAPRPTTRRGVGGWTFAARRGPNPNCR